MTKPPYPGWPPSYKVVTENGGFTRTCFVIEVSSLGSLDAAQYAMVQERLEAAASSIVTASPVVEKVEVVTADRFDTLLLSGLRLRG